MVFWYSFLFLHAYSRHLCPSSMCSYTDIKHYFFDQYKTPSFNYTNISRNFNIQHYVEQWFKKLGLTKRSTSE